MNSYFTYAISILTVFVAFSTFVIAYFQMKIASAKIKLDLYERRFNVYISALNCYQECYRGQPEELLNCQLELVKTCAEANSSSKKIVVFMKI